MKAPLVLTPDFQIKVVQLLGNCKSRGVIMYPFLTLRHPIDQGKLWSQSRTEDDINNTIVYLNKNNAPYLAHCIEAGRGQSGPHVTNAIPGYSWHQWGEAVDCYWKVNEQAMWDTGSEINGVNGYHVYAEEALKLELQAGYFWTNMQDAVHVQLRKEHSPTHCYPLQEINEIMEGTFSDTPH